MRVLVMSRIRPASWKGGGKGDLDSRCGLVDKGNWA